MNPSAEYSFKSEKGPDQSAPQVSNVKTAVNAAERTAMVTWTTDEPGNSQVQYDRDSRAWGGYAFSENDSGMVKQHSVTLTDLETDVLYYVRVSSVDASGNNHAASSADKNPSVEYNFKLTTSQPKTASSGDDDEAGATCFVDSMRW